MDDPARLAEAIHHALRDLKSNRGGPSPLRDLALVRQALRGGLSEDQATRHLLDSAIDELAATRGDMATLLRARFYKSESMDEVARDTGFAKSHLHRIQHAAIESLARIVRRREAELVEARHSLTHRDLPAISALPLIGVAPK